MTRLKLTDPIEMVRTNTKIHLSVRYKFDDGKDGMLGIVMPLTDYEDGTISEKTRGIIEEEIKGSCGYKSCVLLVEGEESTQADDSSSRESGENP